MENQRYMEERLNLRRMLLWMGRRLWILAAAAITGGLLGGGGYLLLHLVILPEREYQAIGKYYLSFQADPEDYHQLSYNGYTWNDLLDTDPVMEEMMKFLPGISREQAAAATKAEILSDIRLLTVTVTEQSPETVDQIMEAVGMALVHLGEEDPVFTDIEIYRQEKAAQIVWDNRTIRAVITGAVIAVTAGLLFLCFSYVWDDSVYLSEEAEQRYGIPVLGLLPQSVKKQECRNDREEQGGLEQKMLSVLAANYRYLCRDVSSMALLSIEGMAAAEEVGLQLKRSFLMTGEEAAGKTLSVCAVPECGEDYEQLRSSEGVVLAMRAGGKNGCRAGWLLSQLDQQGCRVRGLILTDADPVFLRQYYGRSNGRN